MLAAALLLAVAAPAQASYPKAKNGRIVYLAEAETTTNGEVIVMNSDGSGRQRLTNDTASDLDPSFAPNGKLILLSKDVDPNTEDSVSNFEILLMRLDGSIQANLTQSPGVDEFDPSWSPDGKRIAFARDLNPTSAILTDIFVMNANGSGQVNITNTPAYSDGEPDYSPNGKRIAFSSGPFPNRDVSLMNTDGTGVVNLTATNPVDDVSPSFAPDGKRIAFSRRTAVPAQYEAFVMRSDGSNPANVSGGTLGDGHPFFSPDGKRLALERVVDLGPEFKRDIFTINADGSGGATNLTSAAGLHYEFQPSWEYVYRCGGRRATIVGDDGKDKIKGTKKADVIVANGGKDKIRGRGGNDRICGGKGKDTLVGGGGEDRLLGGKGKDEVRQ